MRRADGTFAPGYTGNAGGRPKTAARYRRLLSDQMTDQSFVQIVDKLISLATVEGDVKAARLLLEYCIGRPQPIEVEGDGTSPNVDVSRLVAVLTDDEVSMLLGRLAASEGELTNAQ